MFQLTAAFVAASTAQYNVTVIIKQGNGNGVLSRVWTLDACYGKQLPELRCPAATGRTKIDQEPDRCGPAHRFPGRIGLAPVLARQAGQRHPLFPLQLDRTAKRHRRIRSVFHHVHAPGSLGAQI